MHTTYGYIYHLHEKMVFRPLCSPTNVSLERDWNPYSLLRSGHITFLSISQKRILRTLDSRKSRGGRRKAKVVVVVGTDKCVPITILRKWLYISMVPNITHNNQFLNNLQLEIDQSFDKHSITSLQHVFISKSIFWLRKTFW